MRVLSLLVLIRYAAFHAWTIAPAGNGMILLPAVM
jgi:hypothetical protein